MLPGLDATPLRRDWLKLFRRAMSNGGAALSRAALGSGAFGDALFLTATAAAARTSLGVVVSATAQASTSGVAIDFTSIPAGAKEIVIGLAGVSTNGTSALLVQLGAGSVSASGYIGNATAVQNAAATSISVLSTGFSIVSGAAANVMSGVVVLTLIDAATGTWVCSASVAQSAGSFTSTTSGHKVLGGTLDRFRITTITGADTFDAGLIGATYKF